MTQRCTLQRAHVHAVHVARLCARQGHRALPARAAGADGAAGPAGWGRCASQRSARQPALHRPHQRGDAAPAQPVFPGTLKRAFVHLAWPVQRTPRYGFAVRLCLTADPDARLSFPCCGPIPPLRPDRTVDDMVEEALTQLVQRKLLLACDRKFKKPKPGKTKLVKFPRTLEPAQVRAACRPAALGLRCALQPSYRISLAMPTVMAMAWGRWWSLGPPTKPCR